MEKQVSTTTILELDNPDFDAIFWMKRCSAKYYVYLLTSVITFGLSSLLCVLFPRIRRNLTSSRCRPEMATFLLVRVGPTYIEAPIQHLFLENVMYAVVEVRCQRYYTTSAEGNGTLMKVPVVPPNFKKLFVDKIPEENRAPRDLFFSLYGPNLINLPQSNFAEILMRQIFHPFYIFQYFAVAVWLASDYLLYSFIILFITGGAVYMTTQEIVHNMHRLRELVGNHDTIDIICPNNDVRKASTADLIPGDRFVITNQMVMPCDAIILRGRAVVDESMLTGESVPVTKQAFDNFDCAEVDDVRHSTNIAFSGTKVVQASGYVYQGNKKGCLAVAYKTGFRSAKGQLVASLLNPKEGLMTFFSDALLVILFMLVLTVALYIWTATFLIRLHLSWDILLLKFLDAITIAVPPALTASLTVATAISIDRLHVKQIYVSDTARLNWAGAINAVSFDKTGTLTEELLDFRGIRLHHHGTNAAAAAVADDSALSLGDIPKVALEVMATCHALSFIGADIVGDPLDKELLRASGWTLQPESAVSKDATELGESAHTTIVLCGPPTPDGGCQYEVLRHFDFAPEKLRSGSLVRRPTGEIIYVTKGSPETILSICGGPPGSQTYLAAQESLQQLTSQGFRVVAMAYRVCGEQQQALMSMSQEEIERGYVGSRMEYIGLAFLASKLKHDTKETISSLVSAGIHNNMITGDHIQVLYTLQIVSSFPL